MHKCFFKISSDPGKVVTLASKISIDLNYSKCSIEIPPFGIVFRLMKRS